MLIREKERALFKFENLALLTVLMLPLYLQRVVFFGVAANILDLLLLASIAWGLLKSKNSIFLKIAQYKGETTLIAFLILGFLISLGNGGNYLTGLGIIKSWLLLPILFAFVFYASSIGDQRKKIFFSYYVSAFFVAAASLGLLFLGQVTYDGRLQGFFNSPNYLAMYLAPGIIIGLIMPVRSHNSNPEVKVIFSLPLLIITVALYYTYSYAAWAALIFSLLIIALIQREKKYFFKKDKIITLILIILFLIFSQAGKIKYNNLHSYNRSSLESRIMIWEAAGDILKNNWILGIGPGNFQEKYLEYQKYYPPYLEWAVPHPHNLFLAVWLYGGIIASLSFLALVAFWIRKFYCGPKEVLELAAFGVIVYIFVHGLVDTTYFKNDLAVVFWLAFFSLNQTPRR